MTGAMSWWHWVIVLLALLVLFGSKKLPDAARGLGQSLRIFKSEVKEMQKDDSPETPAAQRELPKSSEESSGSASTTASSEQTKKSA